MYGGKNTLSRASVDRREACSPDVTLSKNLFFDSCKRRRGQALLRSSFFPDRVHRRDSPVVVLTAAYMPGRPAAAAEPQRRHLLFQMPEIGFMAFRLGNFFFFRHPDRRPFTVGIQPWLA